jgi:apoptosis-inducing factor 2
VVVPANGFPTDGGKFDVHLTNGQKLSTELVILATGQTPNNGLIKDLAPSGTEPLINPENGFIRIRPTMQFSDKKYPNLFAVGDIADTGLHKAARPGSAQAAVVAKNIQALIEGREPQEHFSWSPRAIHLSLGLVSAVSPRDMDIQY